MTQAQKEVKCLIDKFVDETNKLYSEWNKKENSDFWEISDDPKVHGIFVYFGENGSISFDGELLATARGYAEFRIYEGLWESIENVLDKHEYESEGYGSYQSYLEGADQPEYDYSDDVSLENNNGKGYWVIDRDYNIYKSGLSLTDATEYLKRDIDNLAVAPEDPATTGKQDETTQSDGFWKRPTVDSRKFPKRDS